MSGFNCKDSEKIDSKSIKEFVFWSGPFMCVCVYVSELSCIIFN